MRAVIQRVTKASVTVDTKVVGSIGKGLCVLLGIGTDDTEKDVDYMVNKILNVRVFDDNGVMWKKGVKDSGLEVLCVSQFTLQGITTKGNKPDFHRAMKTDPAKAMYEQFLQKLGKAYDPSKIQDGEFGAMMLVDIANDGILPVYSYQTWWQKPLSGSAPSAAIMPNSDDGLFGGIATFAHLPYEQCWNSDAEFDIAFIGAPFDTLTSYRPGARFGPSAIREGSRRTIVAGGYNVPLGIDPFNSWAKVVDCGDLQLTPFNNERAIQTVHNGYKTLLYQNPSDQKNRFPRLITLGGDHTITLPILRSLHSAYGPVSVIHFDSHLDTWKPFVGDNTEDRNLNHGTYFYYASEEGLLNKGESIHAGIRSPIATMDDYENDSEVGFKRIEAREIDNIGTQGIIDKIRKTVGDNYVYLSLDIDVLDPAFSPGTGTPETGGWTTRELRRILRGLDGLKIVGADLVEVSPPYDTNGQITAIAAADALYDILSIMVKTPVK